MNSGGKNNNQDKMVYMAKNDRPGFSWKQMLAGRLILHNSLLFQMPVVLTGRLVLQNGLFYQMPIVLAAIFAITACRFEPPVDPPFVESLPAYVVDAHTVVLGGQLKDAGGDEVLETGVLWCTDTLFDIDRHTGRMECHMEWVIYVAEVTGLSAGSKYYFRAYAKNSGGVGYGEVLMFETKPEIMPVYDLSVEIEPPGAGVVEGTGPFPAGENVRLVALAEKDHVFVHWTTREGLYLSTREEYGFSMPSEDVKRVAVFKRVERDEPGTVSDIDGNVYRTVVIGEQEWMAENLRTTRYRDGTAIPSDLDHAEWGATKMGAFGVYPYQKVDGIDSKEEMMSAYGILYNWYATVDQRGLCPDGWQVATTGQWEEMIDYVYANYDDVGFSNIGQNLKSCRQVASPVSDSCATAEHPRWNNDKVHYGLDLFGFSAMPGGYRLNGGPYEGIGNFSLWWTSSEGLPGSGWHRRLRHQDDYLYLSSHRNKNDGFSVRCIRMLENSQ